MADTKKGDGRSRSILRDFKYIVARLGKKASLPAIAQSEIDRTSVVEGGSQVVGSKMDRHSFCGYGCTLLNADIGSFCSIADDVYIGGSAHPIEFVSTSPVFLSHKDSVKTKFSHHDYFNFPRTKVGNDVWIGHGAKIRAGVSVGHGAVIGMGAIVTKNVRPYAIVVGNPAKEVRRRFDDQTVEALLASQWWDRDDDELRRIAKNFDQPEKFLSEETKL